MEKKIKKSAPIRAVQIMRLEFFAKRFNIPVKRLSWGLIVSENEDAEVETTAAVLVKGNNNIFIDILNDRFMPMMNICGCKTTAYIATFNHVRAGFKFMAGAEEKFISCEEIERIFRSKIYSPSLNDEAEKLN